MYPHLMTNDPAKSPLAGILKIDQIAFACYSDVQEQQIKDKLGLSNAKWVEDEVVANGFVYPRGFERTNRAKLLFNYDFGIEVEILRYLEGDNYLQNQLIPGGHICHVGMHLEKGKTLPDMRIGSGTKHTFDFSIVQQVETESHTNQFLVDTGRRYRYTIYDAKAFFGTNLKVIERLEKPE